MMRRITLAAGLLAMLAGSALANDHERTAEDIRSCSRQNFPTQTAEQPFSLRSLDAVGSERNLTGKLRWQKNQDGLADINICFVGPPKFRGSCYLVEEKAEQDDIYVYLPALQRVKRVIGSASSESLLGTDISYEDLKQLQGIAAGGSVTRQDDSMLGEVAVYVIEGRPAAESSSPYSKVLSHVDKASCMPLQVNFYTVGDVHSKRLTVAHETLVQTDGRWLVRNLVIEDMRDKTMTEVEFGEAEYDEKIAKRVFNKRSFYLLK